MFIFFVIIDRSSYRRCSLKKVFLKVNVKDFENFTGKHLCQSLFFNEVVQPATLSKKRLWHIFKNTFFTEPLWVTASVIELCNLSKLITRILEVMGKPQDRKILSRFYPSNCLQLVNPLFILYSQLKNLKI